MKFREGVQTETSRSWSKDKERKWRILSWFPGSLVQGILRPDLIWKEWSVGLQKTSQLVQGGVYDTVPQGEAERSSKPESQRCPQHSEEGQTEQAQAIQYGVAQEWGYELRAWETQSPSTRTSRKARMGGEDWSLTSRGMVRDPARDSLPLLSGRQSCGWTRKQVCCRWKRVDLLQIDRVPAWPY